MRVVGIPGAGKTTLLKRQVEAWHERDGIEPERMVLTSFTRAAANILRGRIPVPTQNASTLHSFAFRGLNRPPIAEADKALVEQWNSQPIPLEWKVGGKKTAVEESVYTDLLTETPALQEYTLYRSDPSRFRAYGLKWAKFIAAWEDFKQQTGSIDFQDMIDLALTDLDVCPGDPDCFVVDEAQDLNPTQWALVHKWGNEAYHRFVVAGDPAQCLFSFVGARPDELLEPLPAEQHHLLGHSWRNPPAVMEVANYWLSKHSGTMMQGRISEPNNAEGKVYRLPGVMWTEPEGLVANVLQDSAEGKTSMILAGCGYTLKDTLTALREFGVPFHNPYRPAEGKWNPLVRREDTTTSAQRIRLFMEGRGQTGARATTWLEKLPAALFQGTRKAALELVGAMSRVESLEPILHPAGAAAWAAGDGEWYVKAFPERDRKPLAYAWQIYRRDPKLLDAPPSAIIGTVHSVKGGEADRVYLFPDMPKHVIDDAHEYQSERDAIIRMVYVAISRARENVIFCEAERASQSWEDL